MLNVECFQIELALKIKHSTLKIKTKVQGANFGFLIGIKKFCVTSVSKFSIELKMTVNVDWGMISAPLCVRTNLAQHAS